MALRKIICKAAVAAAHRRDLKSVDSYLLQRTEVILTLMLMLMLMLLLMLMPTLAVRRKLYPLLLYDCQHGACALSQLALSVVCLNQRSHGTPIA